VFAALVLEAGTVPSLGLSVDSLQASALPVVLLENVTVPAGAELTPESVPVTVTDNASDALTVSGDVPTEMLPVELVPDPSVAAGIAVMPLLIAAALLFPFAVTSVAVPLFAEVTATSD
jgi:hypothetical protein